MKNYRVKEIFGPTLQGEGTYAGSVVMFLRLSGCNKWSGKPEHKPNSICSFCDTDFVGGDSMSIEEIIASLKSKSDCRTLVISGGEPTLQIDYALLSYLTNSGFELHLETNGSKSLGQLHQFFKHITLSPKQTIDETNLEFANDLKLLYPPIADGMAIEDWKKFPCHNVFLQPVWGKDTQHNTNLTIDKVLENPSCKLSLQLHKILNLQ